MDSKKAMDILRNIVGNETYKEIIGQLGGNTVYFPSDAEWSSKDERNLELRNDYYSGKYEITQLAVKYNLSISTVYKIIQHVE